VNYISKALRADFEYITITGEKHEKVLKILAEADIVLDQFILGAYGVLAIEAMALGKPVVAFISDSNKKQYPDDLPIVNANIDNLAQVIAKLIKSGELRHEIGKRSREYVAKYHSYEAYAKRMMQIYNEVMQLPEELFWNRKRLKQN
jgi:glycosyltransferase involved in cell wall biosynthesis